MNRQWWFVFVSMVLFLYGIFCLERSREIQEQVKRLPRMTCEELIRHGPGGNSFITLTDVRLCSAGYAFYRDMDAAMELYLPIYSSRLGQEPEPRELALVLDIEDDRDRERLLAQPNVGELICEIWRRVDELEPWVHDSLAAKYPGIQLRNCRVVSVGLHEPTMSKAESVWWYGIISFLLGGGSWFGWLGCAPPRSCPRRREIFRSGQ